MTQVFVPRESVNDQTVIVQKIHVASGSSVAAGEVIVEIETSKTVIEIQAPEPGVVTHVLKVADEVEVGTLLFSVNEADMHTATVTNEISSKAQVSENLDVVASATSLHGQPALLSRAAETAAKAAGISLEIFRGRWVTLADIRRGRPADTLAEARDFHAPVNSLVAAAASTPMLPALPHQVQTNSMRKRVEIENLVKGRHAETASTIGLRIDLPGDRIVAPDFLFADSISDLVIFEGARLLRQFPELNAFHIDERSNGRYESIDFGISFDNVHNLKVLTLRHADTLGLSDLHREFSGLLDLFESNKPIPSELLGTSTVTISDLSTTSASFMLPLLNGQQSLILGIVKHNRRQFEVFATFDHRVSEGLRVTRFLEALRERVLSHYRDGHGYVALSCSICAKSMHDEMRLGGRGFINMTLPNGDNAMLCRNCFEGR